MTSQNHRAPKAWVALLGCILGIALLALLLTLQTTIKWAGDILLFLPSQLGLVQRVTAEEIQVIDLETPPPVQADFLQAGRYAVFTGEFTLLQLIPTESYRQKYAAPPWVRIKSCSTDEALVVSYVDRGMALYDTPLADGRPIFAFQVATPGCYEIDYAPPRRHGLIFVVPDYTTGRETVIVLVCLAQIAVLLLPFVIIFWRNYRRRCTQIKAITKSQAQRRVQGQSFWEAELQKKEGPGKPESD